MKIHRTALGLSQLNGPVFVVTDDRQRYYRYEKGDREAIAFPRWQVILAPLRWLQRRRLKHIGIPVEDLFLYCALTDWNLFLRALLVASRHGLRVYQAEFPAYARTCLWVKGILGGRVILVEHNVEFERLREQSPSLSSEAFSFLRSTEIDLCSAVDGVIVVSSSDQDTLVRYGVPADKLHVIPHGVDIGAFDAAKVSSDVLEQYGIAPGRRVLVYHGVYRYAPNLEAMRVLATEILPRLNARGLSPAVLALGPGPPDEPLHADIFFTGSVEPLAPYIKAADLAVVPLQRGGGTRMKILDYLAAGVPVVSTSKGVEGLELTDGREVLIRDDYQGFVEAVECLLRDGCQAQSLARSAREFVNNYDWLSIAARYLELFQAILGSEGKSESGSASDIGYGRE